MGRSRGGLTSKIHAVVDTNGLPVRLALTAGEAHDNRLAGKLLSRLKSGSMLLADRGYDADWIRELATKQARWANIPPKSNRNDPICFSPYLYRARNLVERFFNRIKQCRRVATRYDKLAANYLAFIQLASIRLWLRVNEYTASTSAICGTFWERASASPVRPQWLRQKKTGQPVKFELTEQTRQAIDDYVKAGRRKPGEFLFTSRANRDRCISTRQYARLVSEWIASIGLDAKRFGTHSLRRTKATLIYRRTGTFGPSGFCSAIPRSRARSGISASRR